MVRVGGLRRGVALAFLLGGLDPGRVLAGPPKLPPPNDGTEAARPAEPPPTAEPADPPPLPEDPTEAPWIDPEAAEAEQERGIAPGRGRARRPLPPPPRPAFGGIGLFASAGALFGAAVAQQIAAHVMTIDDCVRPLNGLPIDQNAADEVRRCTVTAFPALALRLEADLDLLLAVGLSAGGAAVRARRDAWDDTFRPNPRSRKVFVLQVTGAALMGAALALWVGSAAGSWAGISHCTSVPCIAQNRIAGFVLRETAAGLGAAGAGMLTWGLVYPRRLYEYAATRHGFVPPTLTPTLGPRHAGLVLQGRF